MNRPPTTCPAQKTDSKRFGFKRNIHSVGRWIRGILGLAIIAAGFWAFSHSPPLSYALVGLGLLGGVEALMGWCALRAAGFHTRW